ncbi:MULTISPECIES: NAD(P)-binding domain-containing protein [Streptomycetaceae]|uniref:Oxidoreductase n=1 Tax=Streptantibioticus cattleyicolor (strain ATCC 35852 / DSM 46488 / JCM 4925 / NBRC 14057 / NRRL 8057) TaxID=1003195 RepID=F8JXH5_STREN|nr:MULTISPECIES: NAD(P)-binding domain-containing protein [Streptomycetaceae]AEW95857.1 oxidoreductase [Streptantibioticus cattleyicolor NRRL 8057 = DSM 46488]MYS60399.1 NAD(P)-binding domain-containing protein [Streptomyces sp. SID5468]CCB76194.1 Oxidoreductase [Streptantibioticus cattleyicolor NRRL 8057 = DSM 46488]
MNPVVVIGAGPYGLSAAAHLKGRRMPVRIFGTPLSRWCTAMPRGMTLASAPAASTISAPVWGHRLSDFLAASGEPPLDGPRDTVPLETYERYGRWFARRLVPEVERARVVAVDRRDGEFRLRLDTGEELTAPAVVVAAGLAGAAYVPGALRVLAAGGPSATAPVSHSSHHRDPAALAGREVAVVGAGQSALEYAVLLSEAGATVRLLPRRAARVRFEPPPDAAGVPGSPLGPAWSRYAVSRLPGPAGVRRLPERARLLLERTVPGPCGAWWLRDRFRGRVPVTEGRVTGAALDPGSGRVVLATVAPDGRPGRVAADHVIAATGYRIDVDAWSFLSPGLRAAIARTGGSPRLDAGFGSSVPGLFFTGPPAAATFGPLLRHLAGTGYASPRLAEAVVASRRPVHLTGEPGVTRATPGRHL